MNLASERRRIAAQYEVMPQALEAEERWLRFRFEEDLKAFAAQRLAAGGHRRKSVHLLQGSLCFRTVPSSMRVIDRTQAQEFVKVVGLPFVEEVRLEQFDVKAYRDHAEAVLEETGELLPGVEVLLEREVFSIRFGKEE